MSIVIRVEFRDGERYETIVRSIARDVLIWFKRNLELEPTKKLFIHIGGMEDWPVGESLPTPAGVDQTCHIYLDGYYLREHWEKGDLKEYLSVWLPREIVHSIFCQRGWWDTVPSEVEQVIAIGSAWLYAYSKRYYGYADEHLYLYDYEFHDSPIGRRFLEAKDYNMRLKTIKEVIDKIKTNRFIYRDQSIERW